MKKFIFYIILFFITITVYASYGQNPAPAPTQSKSVLIKNGTAHIGDGTVIQNSLIGFSKGKIDFVYDATTVKLMPTNYDTVIDAGGKNIYPGLICMNSSIGLNEIEAARATNDFAETGNINPSARALTSYNTDSKVIPTLRSNGVLLAQVVPQGGIVSGTSCVMQLDAWNWQDAVVRADEGVHLNWPGMQIFKAWWAPPEEEQKARMTKDLDLVRNLFVDARAYCNAAKHDETNLNLQAMCGVLNGKATLYVHANYVKEIIAAVNMCKAYNIRMVLVGGNDSWRITSLLREHNIPVVIERTQQLPGREDDDLDIYYRLPGILQASGIKYCITDAGFWQMRNLPFQAGNAVAYGLSKEQALMAITLTPATILGIEKQQGSLQSEKAATLIVTDGDIFDMKQSNVIAAYIDGRQIDLDNIQKQLYKKYCIKYGIKQ